MANNGRAMQHRKQGILGWLSTIWRHDGHEPLMWQLSLEFREPPASLDDPDAQERIGEFIRRYSRRDGDRFPRRFSETAVCDQDRPTV